MRVPDFVYRQLLTDCRVSPEDVTVYLAAQLYQTSTVEEVVDKTRLDVQTAGRACEHLCEIGWMFNVPEDGPQAALLAAHSTRFPGLRPAARLSELCQAMMAERFLQNYRNVHPDDRGRLLMNTLFDLVVNDDEFIDKPLRAKPDEWWKNP